MGFEVLIVDNKETVETVKL